ncbi:GNAT family N-acetyltransferase [Antribacter gilvus]|uniref:GNAT family N-acetyltransferase n=1 Tax=Antribacter gilvus TaxID=2304675 RepID=UPI0013E056E8|nr:GNAT family N-acetyltransferase [Antribacter gilvus]
MILRPVAPADVERTPSWLSGFVLHRDGWRDQASRAVLAEEDGQLLGVAQAYAGRVHDSRLYLDVRVDPGRRRQGLGTRLVSGLTGLGPDSRPFRARASSGSPAHRFLEALGGVIVQTCPPMEVGVPAALAALGLAPLPDGVRTVPASAVAVADLDQAVVGQYRWQHDGWAPVAEGFERWLLQSAHEADLDASTCAVGPAGDVLALALAYPGDAPLPVLTVETTARRTADGEALVAACALRSLDALRASGIERLTFDGHVSDPHFAPVLSRLPATGDAIVIVDLP